LQLERVRAAQAPGGRVEVWFQDEARIGQKNSLTRVWGQTGSRPAAPKDLGCASAYVFGAVCPSQGKAAALIMPICNTAAMNHHLSEISSQVAADAHAVVILDDASWHNSHGLVVPGNITLLALPPYSRELNPVERIWHYLRSHWLANSVFRTLADVLDACEMAWNRFATNTGLVRSLSCPETCGDPYYCAKGGNFGPHNLWENRPGAFQSSRFIFATYHNAGVRVFDIENAFQPREAGFFVPLDPERMFDPRPNRPQVIQSAGCFVHAEGVMYLTDNNAGLYILQFEGA
jgi:hypothetical protein